MLEALASGKVRLVGINYKDKTDNARRFLDDLGNPFAAIGVDANGRTGDRLGRLRRAGDLHRRDRRHDPLQDDRAADDEAVRHELMPVIDKARRRMRARVAQPPACQSRIASIG